MLSFATEFPIQHKHGSAAFIDVVRDWILESPYTEFSEEDLADMPTVGEWSKKKKNQLVEVLIVGAAGDESASIKYTSLNRHLEWATTVVFSKREMDSWVGIRTARESSRPAIRLPPAKKPVIVRALLETLGGALDGEINVGKIPYQLAEHEVALAARLILGRATCHLPIIYVSCRFDGAYDIDANALAHDLSGMAHVIVEPSRTFSLTLQREVSSQNVYGGTIGIYWPGGGGRRSFFLGREYEDGVELKRAVIDEIRAALTNRRPMVRCTLSAIQEIASRVKYDALKETGSKEVHKYVEAFDAELRAKDEQLRDAEVEIARLEEEVREYEANASAGQFVILDKGGERDFYPRELFGIVRDAIADAVNHVQPDSRREHVLRAVIDSNASSEEGKDRRERLKDMLRGYRSMSGSIRRGLEELGFSVGQEGKHHKLIYQNDDRYSFSLATTASDHRAGLNTASDIAKRIF